MNRRAVLQGMAASGAVTLLGPAAARAGRHAETGGEWLEARLAAVAERGGPVVLPPGELVLERPVHVALGRGATVSLRGPSERAEDATVVLEAPDEGGSAAVLRFDGSGEGARLRLSSLTLRCEAPVPGSSRLGERGVALRDLSGFDCDNCRFMGGGQPPAVIDGVVQLDLDDEVQPAHGRAGRHARGRYA